MDLASQAAEAEPLVEIRGIALAWNRHAAFYIPATAGAWDYCMPISVSRFGTPLP